jgi:hypothetical protein
VRYTGDAACADVAALRRCAAAEEGAMAKKGVEYRLVWIGDHSGSAQDDLNKAAKDGFKIAGTTAKAVIMERKVKEKNKDEDGDDKDDNDDDNDE